ncbi:hypothetical protein ACO0K3_05065 [Undibacterium sp. Rencai35W]|uniref:hypothetical protein n=1 Tax=Undibacterium sp. Rencai35W TaxID=3413046 RepID=UPI003BF40DBC
MIKLDNKKPDPRALHLRKKHIRKIESQPKNCLFPGCEHKAIGSHLLQKNGIMDLISDVHGKIVTQEMDTFTNQVHFVKKGYGKQITFPLLCKTHDLELFKEMENPNSLNPFNLRHQLLLSYRASLGELSKQRVFKEASIKFLNDKEIIRDYGISALERNKEYWDLCFEESSYYCESLGYQLGFSSTPSTWQTKFIFAIKEIDFLPICCSTIFSDIKGVANCAGWRERTNRTVGDIPIYIPPSVLFHIIPGSNSTYVIYGYAESEGDRISWSKAEVENEKKDLWLRRINEILLLSVESWYCSPDFYTTNIAPRKEMIESFISERIFEKSFDIPFSLF